MSCPARLQTEQGKAHSPTTATRSTRISFECHPDLLLEELLNNDEIYLEDAEDPLDFFMAKQHSSKAADR